MSPFHQFWLTPKLRQSGRSMFFTLIGTLLDKSRQLLTAELFASFIQKYQVIIFLQEVDDHVAFFFLISNSLSMPILRNRQQVPLNRVVMTDPLANCSIPSFTKGS